MRTSKKKYFQTFVPPWMIIGISIVLMAVVVFHAVINYNREKKFTSTLLKEKGAALIRSFEAGAKTGMAGMMGNGASMQTLLEETASLSDISRIFIVDKTGKILAHNDRKMIGKQFTGFNFNKIADSDKPGWRIVNKKNKSGYFEVFKTFLPFLRKPAQCSNMAMMHLMGGRRCMRCSAAWMKGGSANRIFDPKHRPVIFIDMDIKPFNTAITEDIHNSLIIIAVIFLLGMAGIISLFWAQGYTRSRRLLQDTKAFSAEIIRNLPMGIIVVNKDSHINYINDTACFLLNTKFSVAENKNAEKILPGPIWHLHEKINDKNMIAEKEILFKPNDEKAVPASVSVTDIIGEQGDFLGFVFILKDLSEIKALEIKIQRKEKLAALGTLAAGIAHEVRNPLSSIKGYATFFATLFEKKSENRKAAYLMAEEVDRVDRVISELLEFARPARLNLKKTDMMEFINNSLSIIRHEAESANVKIIVKNDEPLPALEIDADRFIQVLLNLYINAIHAMGKGGNLTVKAGLNKNDFILKICDTGTGIPFKDQTDIFNPYFTTKSQGTGLGLAIVYKIIESHNGMIHIISAEGKGTEFVISIPLDSGDAKEL